MGVEWKISINHLSWEIIYCREHVKILSADLWPVVGAGQTFGDASGQALATSQMRLRQLIENVLLYDQVVLPTDDFISLRVLAQTFGAEAIAILLDEEILKFQRFRGILAYTGAGNGLNVIKVDVARSVADNKPVGPMWLPTGVAAASILAELPGVTPLRARQIAAKVIHATKETDLDNVRMELRNRTRTAALSEMMAPQLKISNSDLDNLGIAPDQLRLLGSLENYSPTDDIDKLMAIARTQVELLAKEESSCDDLSTLSPVGKILATKLEGDTSLGRLFEISDVPDLGTAVMRNAITISEIVKLRQSRHWSEFVKWFHEACASDPQRVGKEYVKLLKSEAPLDTGFFRIVRFFVTTVAGFISPALGVAVAAGDSLLIPRLKEPSAKYFIENLEQVSAKQSED